MQSSSCTVKAKPIEMNMTHCMQTKSTHRMAQMLLPILKKLNQKVNKRVALCKYPIEACTEKKSKSSIDQTVTLGV